MNDDDIGFIYPLVCPYCRSMFDSRERFDEHIRDCNFIDI